MTSDNLRRLLQGPSNRLRYPNHGGSELAKFNVPIIAISKLRMPDTILPEQRKALRHQEQRRVIGAVLPEIHVMFSILS